MAGNSLVMDNGEQITYQLRSVDALLTLFWRCVDALLTIIVRWSDIDINDFAYKRSQYVDYGSMQ